MCDPISIGIGALTVGGAIAGHIADKKAYEANKKLAQQDLAIQYSDLNARAQEEMKAVSREKGKVQLEAGGLEGQIIAGAAEGNVAGQSVSAYIHNMAVQESNALEGLSANEKMVLDQIERNKRGAQAETIGRIAGVRAPSALSTGLQIGGSILGAADMAIQRSSRPKVA